MVGPGFLLSPETGLEIQALAKQGKGRARALMAQPGGGRIFISGMQERPAVPVAVMKKHVVCGSHFNNSEERGKKNLGPWWCGWVSESTGPEISSPVTFNNTFSYYFRYFELGFCHLQGENILPDETTKNNIVYDLSNRKIC